jgi:hypothetical protein
MRDASSLARSKNAQPFCDADDFQVAPGGVAGRL